jgi:hypothetical protein
MRNRKKPKKPLAQNYKNILRILSGGKRSGPKRWSTAVFNTAPPLEEASGLFPGLSETPEPLWTAEQELAGGARKTEFQMAMTTKLTIGFLLCFGLSFPCGVTQFGSTGR